MVTNGVSFLHFPEEVLLQQNVGGQFPGPVTQSASAGKLTWAKRRKHVRHTSSGWI